MRRWDLREDETCGLLSKCMTWEVAISQRRDTYLVHLGTQGLREPHRVPQLQYGPEVETGPRQSPDMLHNETYLPRGAQKQQRELLGMKSVCHELEECWA